MSASVLTKADLHNCERRQASSAALLFNPTRHRVRAICVAGFWDGQGQFVRRQPGDAILVSGHCERVELPAQLPAGEIGAGRGLSRLWGSDIRGQVGGVSSPIPTKRKTHAVPDPQPMKHPTRHPLLSSTPPKSRQSRWLIGRITAYVSLV